MSENENLHGHARERSKEGKSVQSEIFLVPRRVIEAISRCEERKSFLFLDRRDSRSGDCRQERRGIRKINRTRRRLLTHARWKWKFWRLLATKFQLILMQRDSSLPKPTKWIIFQLRNFNNKTWKCSRFSPLTHAPPKVVEILEILSGWKSDERFWFVQPSDHFILFRAGTFRSPANHLSFISGSSSIRVSVSFIFIPNSFYLAAASKNFPAWLTSANLASFAS